MKCDELIAEKLSGESFGCEGGIYEVYDKNEVDAAIAELKDENSKLKRALWMARSERAKTTQLLLKNAIDHLESKYKHRFDNMRLQFHVWGVVKRKCRAKAEEYK